MKGLVVIVIAVFLTFTAESASHHKKHKANNNVKNDVAVTTAPGEDAWPSPASIGDFGVPDKFQEDSASGESEEKSVKHHGRLTHKSHSN